MLAVWYADRASGLAAYTLLWLAVLTGIFYNARSFPKLQRLANPVHTPLSWAASVVLVAHVVIGTLDSWYVVSGAVPKPAYSYAFFIVADLVGAVALLLTTTAVAAFADPKRFKRPWDPKVVHAFAYGGFLFGTFHAIAIGTDMTDFGLTGATAGAAFLLYALFTRFFGEREADKKKAEAAERATQ